MKNQSILFLGILLLLCGLFLMIGCTDSGDSGSQIPSTVTQQKSQTITTEPAPETDTKAICGNGIAEKGETYDNCCVDVECPEGFECESNFEAGNTIYFCRKVSKEETYEFEKYLEYQSDVEYEYSKSDWSLINWDTMLSKVQSMKSYISQLKDKGYDVSIDEEYLKHYERRINLNKATHEKTEGIEDLTETKQKEVIDDVIEMYESEIEILNSIDPEIKIELDKQYEYDIDDKITAAKEFIAASQELKEKIEKGYSASIDVSDYETTCHYDDTGYITTVNVGVENTGGFAIVEPTLDLFLMDGIREVDKDTGNRLMYSDLEVDEEEYTELYLMLGYSSGDSVKCKTYNLKINLRSGANPKVIATTTVKVRIK